MDFASLRATSIDVLLTLAMGLLIMVAGLGLLGKILPFSLIDAISKKRNDAVSVILFSVLLGLGIILSAAIRPEPADAASPAASASAASASASAPRGAPRPPASARPRAR